MDVNRFEANLGLEGLLQRANFVGARTRYALNKRLLRDPHSRRLFSEHTPGLCALQARVLGELRTQGISITSLEELFGESARQQWKEIIAIADRFLARELAGMTDGDELQPAVRIDDPLFRLGIAPVVLDVVNSFHELWSKLNQFGMRASFPNSDPSAPRIRNQLWHRDQWDQVKVFLYQTDVDEGNGALEYIPESRRGGRYANLCPLPYGSGPDGYLQIPEVLVEERVVKADRVVCSAPRGSLVFCDTAGLHRGGFALTHPRLITTWAYYRPSAMTARDYRSVGDAGREPSSQAACFALT